MKDLNLIELEMWIQDITDKNNKILDEATKIYKDYPEMTIRQAILKAKEVIECENSK